MIKQFSSLIKTCEAVTKYSIFALVFLVPVFFLPWTSNVLDFNKQAILVFLVFVALFAWLAKVLISGKLILNLNKTHLAVLALFLVFSASTLFSIDKNGSFWGWPSVTSESLLTILCFALFYFLVSNAFSKNQIFNLISTLAVSACVAVFVGVLQVLGVFIPFDFAKTPSFNTVGMVGELGLFTAILLPLFVILEIYSSKWLRVVFGIGIGLSAVALVLINYTIVWWIALASCALLILFGIVKRDSFDLRWLGIPMFFLVLALFFILLQVQLPTIQKPIEVYLKQSTSVGIISNIMKENPVLGVGPGNFSYVFSKYKSVDLNKGLLWNFRFDSAGSKVLNVLATTGILGLLSFLALIGFVIFYGVKFLLNKSLVQKDSRNYLLVLSGGLLVAFLSQVIAYFFHGSSLTLDFLFFFLAACFVGLLAEEKKEFSLNPSSLLTLGVTFVATIFFIFGLGVLVLDGQRYIAEVYYVKGVRAFSSGQIDKGLQNLENAVRLNSKADIYLTQLSEAYLLKLANVISDNSLSDEDKSRITQLLVNNSINSGKLATDANPKNANNWSARGLVYQNLIGTVAGAEDWALSSYEQALLLAPKSPYYPTQKGIVYMTKANVLSGEDSAKKNESLDNAKKEFDKALELKSDYSPAHFQLGLIYYQEKDITKAIEKFEQVAKLNPDNEQVKTILENLRAESSSLEDIDEE